MTSNTTPPAQSVDELSPGEQEAAKAMYRSYRKGIQGKLFFLDEQNCKTWFAAFAVGLRAARGLVVVDSSGSSGDGVTQPSVTGNVSKPSGVAVPFSVHAPDASRVEAIAIVMPLDMRTVDAEMYARRIIAADPLTLAAEQMAEGYRRMRDQLERVGDGRKDAPFIEDADELLTAYRAAIGKK